MEAFVHESVMLRETLAAIAPRSGGLYADATAGGGGHSEALLLASAPDGRVVAVDRDPEAVEAVRRRLAAYGDRALIVHGDYAQLPEILERCGGGRIDGLVADLGVSAHQLDTAERGFSFGAEGPLDMRMDTSSGEPLSQLLERLGERELADIIYEYGEERRSRAVARSIVRAREQGELETTADLRRAVLRAFGGKRGRIDPSTRTFQALRIAVNGELDQLAALIEALPELLNDEAVAVIISFHSLEDRLVKRAFRGDVRFAPLEKRPIVASDEEQTENRRSRSAKLRAARRVPRGHEEVRA